MFGAYVTMLDVICGTYLVAVFLLLPTIGDKYNRREMSTDDLLLIGFCCALSIMELCV